MKRRLALLLILAGCGEASDWSEPEPIEQVEQEGRVASCATCIEATDVGEERDITRFQLPRSGFSLPKPFELGSNLPDFELDMFFYQSQRYQSSPLPFPPELKDVGLSEPIVVSLDEESESHWIPPVLAEPETAEVPDSALDSLHDQNGGGLIHPGFCIEDADCGLGALCINRQCTTAS